MKNIRLAAIKVLSLIILGGFFSASAQQKSTYAEKRFERRATESIFWSMPAVSTWALREGFKNDAGLENHGVAYFSKPFDWHLQLATPNNNALYVFSFWNVEKDGPMVVEVPATTDEVKLFGTAMNTYQAPLVDFGNSGADKGYGGKYIFFPEDYQGPVPSGYIPVYQNTNNAWFCLRTLIQSYDDETVAKAITFNKQIKVYPYNQPELANSEQYVDCSGLDINTIPTYDDTYFDALNVMIQEEKVKEIDFVVMDMLKGIGIEKGKSFNPSKETRVKLKNIAHEAQNEMIDLVLNNPDKFWEGSHWAYLVRPEVVTETGFTFKYKNRLDYTTRAALYYSVITSVVTYGTETNYFVGGVDSNGEFLKGENNYVLHVPANVPVYHFWSAMVYDNKTVSFVKDMPKPGVSGLDKGLIKNEDGSIDIYFGPKAPKGKEANWAPTKPGVDYFLLFRFYGVEKELYEGNWKMGDLVKQDYL